MKTLILTLTFLSSAAFAQTSYVSDLIGTWTVVEMNCTDGSTPKLPFNPAVSTMQLNYDGANFSASLTSAGFIYEVATGTYTVAKNIITMTESKTGKTETAGYTISKQNELVMIKGQGCSAGNALMTTFTKNP